MNNVRKSLFCLISLVLFLLPAISAAGPSAVNLGSSGGFAILSKSGISATGTTSIVGDIGVSPAAATYVTGFGPIADSSNQFAASSLITGKIYAADYAPPTPTKMTTAVSDMETAYTDAAGRTNPSATELGAGNIGGATIAPGLYKWSTGVLIPTSVTLSGGANDVWIFQIAQNLDLSNGAAIILSGGAQAKNVFWQVAGQATLGTTSDFKGIILSQTAIVMKTGARLNGRALAQTAVTLDASAVIAPAGASTPQPTPAPAPQPAATPTPAPATAPTPAGTTQALPSTTQQPSPAPAPQPATAQPSTTASDNPSIIQTPYVPLSGLSESQVAQNLALGLPAGTAPSGAQAATPPVQQPAPAPKPKPAAVQPAPAPAKEDSTAQAPAPKPAAISESAAIQAETPPITANAGIVPEFLSMMQSFLSWISSFANNPGK